MDDWEFVRTELDRAGLPSADFGRFSSGEHPTVIAPEKFDYLHSVPVLLRCLPRVIDPRVKEGIVRSLSTSHARPAAALPLIAEFQATSDQEQPGLKWAVGNALDTVTEQEHCPLLLDLIADPVHGKGRQMVVRRVGRGAHDDEVVAVLLRLLESEDTDVALHAMSALRSQVGPVAARPHIEALVAARSVVLRRQAAKELRSVDRAIARAAAP